MVRPSIKTLSEMLLNSINFTQVRFATAQQLEVMITKGSLLIVFLAFCSNGLAASDNSVRLWPDQKLPKSLVVISSSEFEAPESRGFGSADHYLAQSVAGLAARAVNEGTSTELIYIDLGKDNSYHRWLDLFLKRTGVNNRGTIGIWDLLGEYTELGTVKGYVLYSTAQRAADGEDSSVNVATNAASIYQGVLISEAQEQRAKDLGLKKLYDARGKSERTCFLDFKSQFDRRRALLLTPRLPNNRDLAIAHRIFTFSGKAELAEEVYQWLLSPGLILGWNSDQNEYESVKQLSRWGHVLCPTDWAMNLNVLSADSANGDTAPFDQNIDAFSASSNGNLLSFVLTDGDNLQWILNDFAYHKAYWNSLELDKLPFGFGLPVADLIEASPDALRYLVETKASKASVILAAGYYYPDHLGLELSARQRESLLRFHGKRIESTLKRAGLNSAIFICDDLQSPRSVEAWQIISDAAPSLARAHILQYSPYEAGAGRTWWIDRKNGSRIPFMSASAAIWDDANRDRAGDPRKVANLFNKATKVNETHAPVWVAVHAWSKFQAASEDKIGLPENYFGVSAAVACAETLTEAWKVVSPNQLQSAIDFETHGTSSSVTHGTRQLGEKAIR